MPDRKDHFIEDIPNIIGNFVQTVAASCYSITKKEMENTYGIQNIDDLIDKYGLKLNNEYEFASCPAFIGENDENICVCGLCFAIIILSNVLEENPKNDLLNNQLNALVNTLVVLGLHDIHNNSDFIFWPTTVTKVQEIESGTFNQTTTALSTLLICNFLKKDNLINQNQLKERYELVVNSLLWIIEHQHVEAGFGAWSYGESCTSCDNEIVNTAVLPSFFCYETLQKYLSFFTASPEARIDIVIEINKTIFDRIRSACEMFEKWVEGKQNMNDGGIERRSDEECSSFIHTCLATIIYSYGPKTLNLDVFERMITYLCNNRFKVKFLAEELTEKYQFKCIQGTKSVCKLDTYEIMVYPVMINNIIKLLDSPYSQFITSKQKKQLQTLNYRLKERMFEAIITIRINKNGPYYVVKGVQNDHQYPIYGLYNVQNCLLRIFDNNKRDSRRKITIFTRPLLKYGPTAFLYISLIAVAVLFAVALIISPADAWVSLLFIPIAGLLAWAKSQI